MGEILGQGLLAIVSGGATGLLGVIFQRVFDHWKQKQELDKIKAIHAHEVAMKKADAEIMAQEWAARTKVAQVEGETAREVADSQAFAASFAAEPKRYAEGVQAGPVGGFLLIMADVIRGIVRPGLTIYLAWIATALYWDSQKLVSGSGFEAKLLVGMHQQIVFTLLYLFTTCVLWWFGTRNKGAQPKLR
jgi:hypothetical protein